ncbi:nuclear transport factor 2 family protein [Kutzneria viridogrisea]|uniref:DUF4440 domain-containing protein n=2 Tax=Kutzneria TaxID=43356 RepID=W5WS90_9PSEU|nr:nuclear transport factor 2 family protein [Kutzneria albida]AHI01035.1 hypothetical protein KALB_7677 [Kutzneria albida DSM 43870]MBA8926292.1 ketosteroid isomerase-like protein [Kutzneria viridogrisea]
MTVEQDIRELSRRWTEAEQRGDVAALEALTTEDFTMVGPLGFVLDRQQWLHRYGSGSLVTESLSWQGERVREYGDTAVAIGLVDQRASHQGNPAGGRFRATQISVRRNGNWVLAGLQFSPVRS